MTSTITNYDAEFCGHQPVHLTNHIQPHGVWIAVSNSDFTVVQVSENVHQLFELSHREIVGKSLNDLIDADSYSLIETLAKDNKFRKKQVHTLTLKKADDLVQYRGQIHEMNGALVIEIEFTDKVESVNQSGDTLFELNQVLFALQAATTVQEVCDIAAVEIKKLSGYDKVMIYSFDEEWNGKVVAQAMEPGMDDFLGLQFPASDIPRPVRELYFKNAVRLIPYRDYEPVALYPQINPLTGAITDLSSSNLRSVAQVHIEYLTNLNIQSTLSSRLVYHNKLWGLISCGHRSARYSSINDTTTFELISNIMSAAIGSRIDAELLLAKNKQQQQIDALMLLVKQREKVPIVLAENEQLLLDFLHAEGCAIVWEGKIHLAGVTPSLALIEELMAWLVQQPFVTTTQLPALHRAFDKATTFADTASGLLVLPILPEAGNYILGFRPEKVKPVLWGGNPNNAVVFEDGKKQYHPRNSFDLWKQTVRYTATPWPNHVLDMVEKFRNLVVEHSLHQNNKELVALNEEFQFVADSIPQVIWAKNESGNVEYFNRRWIELTGLSSAELLRSDWQHLIHPDDVEKRNASWSSALKTRQPYEFEYRLLTLDKSYRWFLARALPYVDHHRQVTKWYGTLTDITEQKNNAQQLEREVEIRTSNLSKANLRLEQLNSELVQFLNLASHDLQEPVRKIHIFAGMLKTQLASGLGDNTTTELIDKMLSVATKMRVLIVDLHSYSSISVDTKFSKQNLNELLEEAKATLQTVTGTPLTIESDTLPFIECIPELLKLLFTHLLSNAAKFNKHKQPAINIRSTRVNALNVDEPEAADGAFIKLDFTDNGIGFEQQYAEEVFKIFRRLHDGGEYVGTGIGLATVKKIVDLHYGVISVKSVPGDGSTFSVVLPVSQKQPAGHEPA